MSTEAMNTPPANAPEPTFPPVETLAGRLSCAWPHIESARTAAIAARRDIEAALSGAEILRPDTGLVVFGSLARGERTEGSDVDWTLLVDGHADGDDLKIAQQIAQLLADQGWSKPSPTGAFGALAFSPDLIHLIGGAHDTNENTTRRVLLLLESASLGDDAVRERVVRGVLNRYLSEDTPFRGEQNQLRTPRFLLNDVVRFWRTMAVDFASKQRERAGQGWGLRNAKLRLSRKLIFVSGLLMCYRFQNGDAPFDAPREADAALLALVNRLMPDVDRTPLDVVAQSMLELDTPPDTARALFDAYDGFLAVLDDAEQRRRLDGLSYENARGDELFGHVRQLSKQFQDALIELFFHSNDNLREWMQEHGVF